MRTLLPILALLVLATVGIGQDAWKSAKGDAAKPAAAKPGAPSPAAKTPALPPKTGSHVKPDDNVCIQCHQEQDPKDPVTKRLYIDRKALEEDVHWKNGVNCSDCHGGDYKATEVNEAHAKESGFRGAAGARKMCAVCHEQQGLGLVMGIHAHAGEKDEQGRGTVLDCRKCHGENQHRILPANDSRAPVFVNHQIETCGKCHEEQRDSYANTSHAHGLYQSGLLVTATCASCHGAHGVFLAGDDRSTLYRANVATTCGKCHRFIAERLGKSVHGQGGGPGGMAAKPAQGGKSLRQPSCTSCHQGHEISLAASARFRQGMPNLCGNCHAELSSRYAMSIHGELTELGYQPAANCFDCHRAHSIEAVANPASSVAGDNRLATCRKCHPRATANFVQFDPHVNYNDRKDNAVVYWVYRALLTLLLATFGFFGLHAVCWFVRGIVDVFRKGRPKGLVPGEKAYVRFVPVHRRAHAVLLLSFLGLALTGLPLKYSNHDWAKASASFLGGFAGTSFWHRVFALVTFTCFGIYMVRLARQFLAGHRRGLPWLQVVFGPDSPVPNWRDVKDFFKMLRWFMGLGRKPGFERWAYWEKFDFWGACADIVIIGSTGLILWFPAFFCLFLPGVALNVAKVIHSTQALLATGFIFAIHFFNIHLRAEKFPADMSLLIGLVSEEEFREERPDYFDRLQRQGDLEGLLATVPSRRRLWLVKLAGFAALAVGLALLLGIVFGSLSG
ncbi:MAG: cytochrome c3 family protein [Thermoguttaceae bacterium]